MNNIKLAENMVDYIWIIILQYPYGKIHGKSGLVDDSRQWTTIDDICIFL